MRQSSIADECLWGAAIAWPAMSDQKNSCQILPQTLGRNALLAMTVAAAAAIAVVIAVAAS